MPNTKLMTLAGSLFKAQISMGSVTKDGHNDFSKYDYVTAETMILETRKVLLDAGLVVSAGSVEIIPNIIQTSDGNDSRVIVRDWPAVVQKGRPLDKAVAGALTTGLSYTLRDLLLLPRIDDADGSNEMDHPSRDRHREHTQTRRTEAPPNREQTSTRATEGQVTQLRPQHCESGTCPSCGGKVWDNRDQPDREAKRRPKWSCGNRGVCQGGRGGHPWGSYDDWPEEWGINPDEVFNKVDPNVDERGESFNADQEVPF